jgi:hypothetical protein
LAEGAYSLTWAQNHVGGLVFLTPQSLCLVRGQGRGWHKEKSSLDLAKIKLTILSIGGQCLTPTPTGPTTDTLKRYYNQQHIHLNNAYINSYNPI